MFSMPNAPTPSRGPLVAAPLSETDAEMLADALKALADPVRLMLVSLIAATECGEACACDLTAPTGKSQSTVSHHLSLLVKAGIIHREQRGKWAWFSLDHDRINSVCSAVAGRVEFSTTV